MIIYIFQVGPQYFLFENVILIFLTFSEGSHVLFLYLSRLLIMEEMTWKAK